MGLYCWAIVTDSGAIAENGAVVEMDDHAVTQERMNALKGTVWVIKNKIKADYVVYLPEASDVRRVLNNEKGPLIWRVKFTVAPTSYRTVIYTSSIDGEKIPMYNGTSAIQSFTAQPGKFYEAWLICDGESTYWQIREI